MRSVVDVVNVIKRGRAPSDAETEQALAEIDEIARTLDLSPAWKPIRALVAAAISAVPLIVGLIEIAQAAT